MEENCIRCCWDDIHCACSLSEFGEHSNEMSNTLMKIDCLHHILRFFLLCEMRAIKLCAGAFIAIASHTFLLLFHCTTVVWFLWLFICLVKICCCCCCSDHVRVIESLIVHIKIVIFIFCTFQRN